VEGSGLCLILDTILLLPWAELKKTTKATFKVARVLVEIREVSLFIR
jgi:hypothetical protein